MLKGYEMSVGAIISMDAETNGLRGQAFAIAGVAYDEEGAETSRFVGRCPIDGPVNSWVEENVLPMAAIEMTHDSYESLLKDFMAWHQQFPQWNSWDKPEGYQTLWHMGHVVETRLFSDAFQKGIIGEFDSPYCPVEVASLLQAAGEQSDSVDAYIKKNDIALPELEGGTHNPLYDSIVAAKVYFHLQNK